MRRAACAASTSTMPRGTLTRAYPYADAARRRARQCPSADRARASRPGDRIALRRRDRRRSSRRCSSARSMPAPGRCRCRCRPRSAAAKPISTSSRSSCAAPIRRCCSIRPSSPRWRGAAAEAGRHRRRELRGVRAARARPPAPLPQADADDIAYLQYSSGSTRFPHGVAITHRALLDNLAAHGHGMHVARGRSLRLLAALVSRHGAGRLPALAGRQPGLDRLSQDRGFRAAPAGLARSDQPQRRAPRSPIRRPSATTSARGGSARQTDVAGRFDLSRWRLAGNGADMIRPDVMQAFVDAFAPAGFDAQRVHAQLRPRRGDACRLDHAAGRRHRRRAGRGDAAFGRRRRTRTGRSATARSSIAARRCAA